MTLSPDDSSSSCTFSDSYCCEGEVEYRAYAAEDRGNDRVSVFGEESFEKVPSEFGSRSDSGGTMYGEGSPDLRSEDIEFGEHEASREEEFVPGIPDVAEELPVKQSIFVHSSPTQFPDIAMARKSVFGSIFVRAPVAKYPGSGSSRKTGVGSQFNMIPAFLDYVEKGSYSVDSGMRSTLKGSIFRAFEKRGIAKEASTSSGSQWDVYPITKSALFSFHIYDRVHHTRNLSRIEERIVSTPVQVLKFAHAWPSGSTWTGHWDGLGMAGAGTYIMPHEVCYIGKMQDGMCHDDDATLIYPNGFRALHCNYVNGELTDYQFQFPDSLDHEKENWEYCRYPDRRFWSEVQNGLKPAKIAQKTQEDPPRKIPQNCYDTNDGFYNPKTKMLLGTEGELLRVPTKDEEKWIKSKCRKGFHEYTGFRPELYENWYNDDEELIRNIADMRDKYMAGIVTYEELYQFYADNDLLPTCSTFQKTKTSSEMDMEKMSESCPSPKKLVYRLEKRYEGHRIPPRETSAGVPRKPKKSTRLSEAKKSKNPSLEKFSWKIKFDEGNKTPTASIANTSIEGKDSKSILKKMQQPEESKKETYGAITPDSLDALSLIPESNTSAYGRRMLNDSMKEIILDIVNDIVLEERERHRNRLVRTQSVGNLSFGARDEKEVCVRVLEELYSSIQERDEFCDSTPQHACDLKKLAQDRFQIVKYWGKRIFTLSFDEKQ